MKKFILILSVAFIAISCERTTTEFFRLYITSYDVISNVSLRLESENSDSISCYFGKSKATDVLTWKSKGEQKERYDQLCRKNNDMTFNREITYMATPGFGCDYLAEDIVGINVLSDANFNESHPAGTSLNDIISVSFYTAKPFIDSGYLGFERNNEFLSLTKINKPISELLADDTKVVQGRVIYFIINQHPTLAKVHNLTFTIQLDNDKVLKASIKKTW